MYINICICVRGSAPKGGFGALRCLWILGEHSARQVPIRAVAARWLDNPRQTVFPRRPDF